MRLQAVTFEPHKVPSGKRERVYPFAFRLGSPLYDRSFIAPKALPL
jgi:hypothetical protein